MGINQSILSSLPFDISQAGDLIFSPTKGITDIQLTPHKSHLLYALI